MGFFSFLVRSDPAASPLAEEIPPELEGLILAHSDDKPRGKSSRRRTTSKRKRRINKNSRSRDHKSCPNLDYYHPADTTTEEEDHNHNNMSASTLAIDMSHSSLRSSLRRGNSCSSIMQEAANASFRTGECIESQIEMLQQQQKSFRTIMTRSHSYQTIGR